MGMKHTFSSKGKNMTERLWEKSTENKDKLSYKIMKGTEYFVGINKCCSN
jgi:hypothetical protein